MECIRLLLLGCILAVTYSSSDQAAGQRPDTDKAAKTQLEGVLPADDGIEDVDRLPLEKRPSDANQLPAAEPLMEDVHESFLRVRIAYAVSMVATAGTILAIYSNRGIKVCLAIVCNVFALSVMTVLIKSVYYHHFEFPQWLSAFNFFTTAVVGFGILCFSKAPLEVSGTTLLWHIVPLSVFVALSIGFSNASLLYCEAHFFEMLSCTTLPVTALLGIGLGRPFHWPLAPPLLLITLGLLVVSFGEVNFSIAASTLIIAGVLCRATKAQLQGMLLSGNGKMQQLGPIELVSWTSLVCFAIIASWSILTEGTEPYTEILKFGRIGTVFLVAGNSAVINVTALLVMKELGPIAQQAVGSLKGILACMSATAMIGEVVTIQQIVGYGLVIFSCYWYNKADMRLREGAERVPEEKTLLLKKAKNNYVA